MEVRGGCLCGHTRYVLHATPRSRTDCHCLDYPRSAGAPYVAWGGVDRTEFAIERDDIRWGHYAKRIRGFAARCGTHMAMRDTADSEDIEVTLASLDDPAPFPPEKIIWTEDKLPWVTLDPRIPAFPRNAPPPGC